MIEREIVDRKKESLRESEKVEKERKLRKRESLREREKVDRKIEREKG